MYYISKFDVMYSWMSVKEYESVFGMHHSWMLLRDPAGYGAVTQTFTYLKGSYIHVINTTFNALGLIHADNLLVTKCELICSCKLWGCCGYGETTEDACVLQMSPICIKCSPWVHTIALVLTMRPSYLEITVDILMYISVILFMH